MRTLLITDDHESVLQTLGYVLELRGYRTLLANSGNAALDVAAKETFDVALVDLRMAGMDGFATCRSLRERAIAAGRDVPVFMMTAAYTSKEAEKASNAGAVTLLKKPFDYDEFLTAVERYCRGEATIPPLTAASASEPTTGVGTSCRQDFASCRQ